MTYLAKDVLTTLAVTTRLVKHLVSEVEAMNDLDYLASSDGMVRDTSDNGFSCSFHPDIGAIAAEEGGGALTEQLGEWLLSGTLSCMELVESLMDIDFESLAVAGKRHWNEGYIASDEADGSIGMTKL